jgi:hypothetical protein
MNEQKQEHRDVICKHGKEGYCFDCVRERHNEDVLDGRFDEDTTTNHTEMQGPERLPSDIQVEQAATLIRIWFYRNDFDSAKCAREVLEAFVWSCPPNSEFFWVIERFENGQSKGYWNGMNSRSFISDIDCAVQFRRKEDALPIHSSWHWTDTRITQHGYIRADLPATPTVDPVVISLVVREVIDLIQDEYEHGAASIEPGVAAILNKHLGAGKQEGNDSEV